MSEEWQAYIKDPRTVCKYGVQCYQKNPEHHKTYKHPPLNSKKKGDFHHNSPMNKRLKASPRPESPKQNSVEIKTNDSGVKNSHNLSDANSSTTGSIESTSDEKKEDSKFEKKEDSKFEKEEDSKFKIPEVISYHDKGDYTLFKDLFLVEMPKDFFDFYKFLEQEQDMEKTLKSVNLQLIGPFDLLLGKLPILDQKELYLLHWRFFYDPPEFQAVLKKTGKSEYHIGYFRDEPDSPPVFLASADSAKDCRITPMAENLFATVYLYLQKEQKTSPFISVPCQKLMEKVRKWAETNNYSLQEYDMKKRLAQTVTKTFHSAGIVVPFNKKTELGYRKLVETDANIKKLFSQLQSAKTESEKDKLLSEIQPVITYASIAVDECDFGTGLEAGIDLFCSGIKELQPSALASLRAVYSLLNRQAFSDIIETHIKYRRKGPNMSLLSG